MARHLTGCRTGDGDGGGAGTAGRLAPPTGAALLLRPIATHGMVTGNL